ncbi:hypothetical protein OG883_38760 [Streptomyces sp. NBC_01142]|uniref:hypothetical protein n=1 Tax=Streptomyces sp. NBC_01142 TaxID=2975865 RepID=UPI002258F7AC|nr:hypothetical protein [Streptomyces sp. NBC_01142]MCX4825686.1 hypothetical protein [Streptomyces sp. NBC_01142]
MGSFTTHRLRAHDRTRSPVQRFGALRTCIAEFAPYGFRATYHHVCRSAGIPAEPEVDSEAVVRAVEELHAAREIWLAEFRVWQVRRRTQKAVGVRIPDPPEPRRLLWYPDPEFHPAEPLAAVMPRILRAPAGDLAECPVCEAGRGRKSWHDGFTEHQLCAGCGVSLAGRPTEPAPGVEAARAERWRLVWRRRV